MRPFCLSLLLVISAAPLHAKVVVFSESDFPVVDSQPVSSATLGAALGPVVFAGIDALQQGNALSGASLLVLPYGSAVPVEAWASIDAWLRAGGNLLILGGQPLRVPVTGRAGAFTREAPQDTFSRVLDFRHTYAVPAISSAASFAWRDGYSFLPKIGIQAERFFAVEGRLNGLGYMVDADGDRLAAPVIVADRPDAGPRGGPGIGARIVALDFDPQSGYWDSADGIALIRAAAGYAQQGATEFSIEAQYSALRPGELPLLTVHLRHLYPNSTEGTHSQATVEMFSADRRIDSATIPLEGPDADASIPFRKPLPPGFYTVKATWSVDGKAREYYANGFRVEELADLETGPALGVDKDFLTRDGKPFFPVGTNYFGTEENGWDFSGPRNALVWEQDFADMERHGVSFVRTGVWMSECEIRRAPHRRSQRALPAQP